MKASVAERASEVVFLPKEGPGRKGPWLLTPSFLYPRPISALLAFGGLGVSAGSRRVPGEGGEEKAVQTQQPCHTGDTGETKETVQEGVGPGSSHDPFLLLLGSLLSPEAQLCSWDPEVPSSLVGVGVGENAL